MSEDLQKKIDTLTSENNNLKQQVANHPQILDSMNSQLDAHREQLNEALNAGITFRTSIIHLKKLNNTLTQQLDNTKKTLDGVNKQLEDATKRITELEAST